MFWNKKEEKKEKEEKLQVKCDKCKHYIDKADAQAILSTWLYYDFTVYYCPMHRRLYDFIKTKFISCKEANCTKKDCRTYHEKAVFYKNKVIEVKVKNEQQP